MIGVWFFCICLVLFSMNTCADFYCLQNFGILLWDLAVVMKFGCHIDRTISFYSMIGAQFSCVYHVLFSTNMQIFPVCRILVFCYNIK